MRKKLDKALLIALACGGIGFLLNMAVVLQGYDSQGLPKRGFFPALVLPFFAVAAALVPVFFFGKGKPTRKYAQLFAPSPLAAGGIGALALGLVITAVVGFIGGGKVWLNVLALAAALALIPCALCRLTGKRPVWLCWGVVAVYLIVLLIGSYSVWCRQASIHRFLYQLLAGCALMLAAYQQAAADAGIGSLKEYLILSLMCVTLCPIAILGSENWLLYGAFLIYHVLNLLSLDLTRRKTPEGE